MAESAQDRQFMVVNQLRARGLANEAVLRAMEAVPREEFLPAELRGRAYADGALPIAEKQTMSQPYIVAFMADALRLTGTERVLEVGTGSGYAAAVLACIVREVVTIERHASLARGAREALQRLGYDNVAVVEGDGTLGVPDRAPFDAIVVAAASPAVPPALRQQLAIGGRLVIPLGPLEPRQRLVRITRVAGDSFETEDLLGVHFVPLVADQ